ncbi:hypothetical protein ACN20G_36850 (plasmid) [Streptomyces sp. BI20]|uniref:hypothetical protein n=1 Tax=Streptomyces sp. BI20 TaxID=3403460 RepID=UPI003C70E0F1
MALRQPSVTPDDPRLQGHATEYQASRGGYYPTPDRPVPGTPQAPTGTPSQDRDGSRK